MLLSFILLIILPINNLKSQCALRYDKDYSFTSVPSDLELRRIDKSIIRTAVRNFELKPNSVIGFYFEDLDFKGSSNGRAYAISSAEANRLIKQKFGKAKTGYIKIGYNFVTKYLVIDDTTRQGRFKVNAITNFVYAHEIAHLVQKNATSEDKWNWMDRNDYPQKLEELNADFAAGLYMGGRYLFNTNEKIYYNQDPEKAKENFRDKLKKVVSNYVYNIGDTITNDYHNHHGTPKERVTNFVLGLELGIKISTSSKYVPMKQYMFLRWNDLKKQYEDEKIKK